MAQLQGTLGNRATTLLLQRSWLGDVGHALGGAANAVIGAAGDVLGSRDNEAYLDAIEDLQSFVGETHSVENHQSATQMGAFNAAYHPTSGRLTITVRCRFTFADGSPTQFPVASPADLTWDGAARADYQSRWLSTSSAAWSGNHTFHCQREWWEKLSATTTVNFIAVNEDEHFHLNVTKIPPGEFRTSSVRRPDTDWWFTPGSGDFDSNDLDAVNKGADSKQVPAVHEAGHMLGLDDEYTASGAGAPKHSDLCDHQFGHGVAKADDGRIMSAGGRVDPEHGVTFLEALEAATDEDWGLNVKPPKGVPAGAPAHPLGNPPEAP